MFDAQAWYVRDIILGKITLPSLPQMQRHTENKHLEERALTTDEQQARFQGEYIKCLIQQTDYPSFDVDGVHDIFMQWKQHKKENIMQFRDKTYRSVMTGKIYQSASYPLARSA